VATGVAGLCTASAVATGVAGLCTASAVAVIVAVGAASVEGEAGVVAVSTLGADSSSPPHAVNNAPTIISANKMRADGNDVAAFGNWYTQEP
jgi:hypothetical protein